MSCDDREAFPELYGEMVALGIGFEALDDPIHQLGQPNIRQVQRHLVLGMELAGHQQGLQIYTDSRADGAMIHSIIAGSCYEHNEDYMGPQGNKHWRGALMLHDVHDGEFDIMPISLKYFNQRKYK
jgi:hypothetical protein